jgi:hypothetical protein
MTVSLEPGAVVRFVYDNEKVTGSHLPTLMVGRIADRPVFPCALRVIIPVEVETFDSDRRIIWVNDDQVLTVEDNA